MSKEENLISALELIKEKLDAPIEEIDLSVLAEDMKQFLKDYDAINKSPNDMERYLQMVREGNFIKPPKPY